MRRRDDNRRSLVSILAGITGAAVLGGSAVAASDAPAGGPGGDEDVSKVSVRLDTLTLLNGRRGDIEVLQLLRVINAADRPFLGEPVAASGAGAPPESMPRPVFRVPVPEGAFDVAPADSRNPQGMAEGPAGIVTTAPLPPGETLISFIYRIRPGRGGWALARQIDYPTESINMLVGPGLEIESAPGFRFTERKTLGGVEYRRFQAGPFSPGSVLTADVGFAGDSPANLWGAFAAAAAAVAAAGLGAGLYVRRRSAARRAEGVSRSAEGPAQDERPEAALDGGGDREALIVQIAALDERFDSGSIAEDVYRSRRRELKEKLALISEAAKP